MTIEPIKCNVCDHIPCTEWYHGKYFTYCQNQKCPCYKKIYNKYNTRDDSVIAWNKENIRKE